MDKIIINKIKKEKNKIIYDYDLNGIWNQLLKNEEKMFIEYDCNIEDVPDSIAIIPLLSNILPIAWIYNLEIDVMKLDKIFFESIKFIKSGYQKMYPNINFQGQIHINEINEINYQNSNNAVMFSGGVDAVNTLLTNMKYKPDLITVWGADINLKDIDGWNLVSSHHMEVAKKLNFNYHYIKSNFKVFINDNDLTKYINKFIPGCWWHEMQHGIGLIGLVAPISYLNGYGKVFIASSYTKKDIGNYTCASDPTIDNFFKYSNCITIHDGYEFNRQDKIKNICEYIKNNNSEINLRVCWESDGGFNCSKCEKCCRTMLGILTEKENPEKFGFIFNSDIRKNMMRVLKKPIKYNLNQQYFGMQRRFIENYTIEETPLDLMWFRKIKIRNRKPIYIKIIDKILNFLRKIKKNMIKK